MEDYGRDTTSALMFFHCYVQAPYRANLEPSSARGRPSVLSLPWTMAVPLPSMAPSCAVDGTERCLLLLTNATLSRRDTWSSCGYFDKVQQLPPLRYLAHYMDRESPSHRNVRDMFRSGRPVNHAHTYFRSEGSDLRDSKDQRGLRSAKQK